MKEQLKAAVYVSPPLSLNGCGGVKSCLYRALEIRKQRNGSLFP